MGLNILNSKISKDDVRNHVKQGTDKLARCVGHLKVSTRLVFEQVLSGRVLGPAGIFPSGHGSSQWNTLLNPKKIAGSWQLPGITWYYLVLLDVPPKYAASLFFDSTFLDLSWTCLICCHAALGFIMDSDRCCAAPACRSLVYKCVQ